MTEFKAVYVPIGVPTFHLESAQIQFEKSIGLLKSLSDSVEVPDEMLLSIDKLNAFLDGKAPDLIILQNITFANSAYTAEIMRKFDCPVLLWTLREPVIDGGRLRLNSLTGAYSAANTIKQFRDEPLQYVFGSPDEENVRKQINSVIRAAKMKKQLRSLNIVSVGHTPQGFGFGRALDNEMLKTFGSNLISIEARELIDIAKGYTDEEVNEYLLDAEKRTVGLENTPEKNRRDFARLYKAYAQFVKDNNIGALSSRCWPDFFTAFGTPVCAVLAMLNDLGVAASCEADTYGALSMYIGAQLTGSPVFFGDPVSLDEKENTITFWHCGTAACSLAREDTGAEIGVHCNRKIGPTMEFGCKPSKQVTVFRIGKSAEGKFRVFVCKGEALDKPKQFNGTSVVVKTQNDAENIVVSSVKAGFEPHFAVAYGDIYDELVALSEMLNLEVCEY
jgi:L-fucose isomerase-like protein